MSPRILIRSPNHLGDCIMALPMINETREAYPGSHVTVLAPEKLSPLFEQNPGVDRILRIPTEHVHGLIGVVKIKDIISEHDFDIGFVLPPSFGAASGFKLAGVKERIGYIADGRRLLLSRPLPLPEPLNSEHRSITYFNLLRRASGAQLDYVKPKMFISDDESQEAAKLLDGFGIGPTDRFAVVAFRAVAESRRWGIEKYGRLTQWLVGQRDMAVVLVGTEDDRRSGDEIAGTDENHRIVNLAGKTSIRELAAVMSRATLFVGNDSGPAHLAAAVGAPVVVLSGADDPGETSPMAALKRLIYLDHLECISCVKNSCPLKGDDHMRCMRDIPVSMVSANIDALLAGETQSI